MECLDANAVQDMMSGALDDTARGAVASHLDGCDECRLLVSMLARDAARAVAAHTIDPRGDAGLDATVMPPSQIRSRDDADDAGLLATAAPGATASTASGLEETQASTPDVGAGARIRKPSAAQVPAGKRFGRYLILEKLGAGAMGVVFRADDPSLGRTIALKQLHHPDPTLTERLVREARSMAQVNHPNVVAVYDVGVEGGTTYIAMELVTGGSLRDWQKQAKRPVDEILEVYLGAGRGLAAAHAAGIVHRDFKPDNVLVGTDGRVRVTDFGLAAVPQGDDPDVDGPAPSDVSLTAAGVVLGTPAYMAPEQFLGGNVDSRTDQFNFCVALFEALYGRRPFDGKTFVELADNVCEGKLRDMPARARVSGKLHAIVLRGLKVKPGDRFASMDHLLVELARDRAGPWRRTRNIAFAIGGVLALGLVADFAVRDRVGGEIKQSFSATGRQVDRAFDLLTSRFDANANQVYGLLVMRDVAGHRDQADFGLGDEASDQKDLGDIHDQLTSQDWKWVRQFGKHQDASIVAIGDYKGRMLYTSADPARWKQDLLQLPWVKDAIDHGRQNLLVLARTDDPKLAATGMLGPAPPKGLVFFYMRTLMLNGEAASQLIQVLPAAREIDAVRLDDETQISLVAPDKTAVGDLAPALVAAAPASGGGEAHLGAKTYDLETIPLKGYDGEIVGHVVLARAERDVLSLFPNARLVFALALLGAIGLAIGTAARAHAITHARVS